MDPAGTVAARVWPQGVKLTLCGRVTPSAVPKVVVGHGGLNQAPPETSAVDSPQTRQDDGFFLIADEPPGTDQTKWVTGAGLKRLPHISATGRKRHFLPESNCFFSAQARHKPTARVLFPTIVKGQANLSPPPLVNDFDLSNKGSLGKNQPLVPTLDLQPAEPADQQDNIQAPNNQQDVADEKNQIDALEPTHNQQGQYQQQPVPALARHPQAAQRKPKPRPGTATRGLDNLVP